MIVAAQAEEPGADQGPMAQVEGNVPFFLDGMLQTRLGDGHGSEVKRHRRQQDQARLAICRGKCRAQDLVASDDPVQAALEGGRVEWPSEPKRTQQVVTRGPRDQLVEKPQPLLTDRRPQRPVAGDRDQRRGVGGGTRRHARVNLVGEAGNGGRLEQAAPRDFHPKQLPDSRQHLRGQQRLAADLEEVVVNAHLVGAQDLGPDLSQPCLGRIGGRRDLAGVARLAVVADRRFECPTIHFAGGSQRNLVEEHDRLGNGMLGQLLSETTQQRAGRGALAVPLHDECDEPGTVGPLLLADCHGIEHGGVLAQGTLDFRRVDSKATNLDLRVDSTHQLDRAIR